jgi:putative ABC transport system permease protein
MLKTFSLSAKLLWREWRAGEWFVVFFALLLAITAITSIHFFTDRIVRGLEQQGARFLGGDLVISSSSAIPDGWVQKAQTLQLKRAEVWSYPSVISANKKLQLVNVQAVSDSYPILGENNMRLETFSVWVEPRLLPLLASNINDMITIGAKSFQMKKILTADIDMLNTGWNIAPRVLMRLADVPATQTVLPGSRVDYRLLLAGDKDKLQQFRLWVTPQLQPGQTLLDVHNQKFALLNVLQRTESYLQLVLLVCLVMSGVAIALSIQQYLRRHYAHVALWRCLGAKQQQITKIILYQLLILAFVAGAVAIAMGYLAQLLFANLFKTFLLFPLPAAGFSPVVLGFVTSLFLLFTFAYPILYVLPRTPPLYIWRNEVTTDFWRGNIAIIIAIVCMTDFMYWFMDYSLLTLYFLGALIVSIVALYGLGLLLLRLLRSLILHTEGPIRRGLSQLVQHPKSVIMQFIGFNLILVSLIVVGLIRTHLLVNWQQSLSTKAPNYFAINIAPTDLTQLEQFFQQHQVAVEGIYPMIRGRLVALNGNPILAVVPPSESNNNALHRELNLSWMVQLPSDNKVVSGPDLTTHDTGKAIVSVEKKLADDLHLKIGNTLTFQIGEKRISAVINNLRTVDWSSFHPNFFMIFPPGLLDKMPTTYITSFHLASDQAVLLNQLVQMFPNITVIDVASLLVQMQDLVGKITLAVQYLFLFALGAGGLIFVTSLQASMDERRVTYYLLHVLGAGRKYIRRSVMVEFCSLFALIGVSAVGLGYFIVYLLESRVFHI